MHNKKLSHLFGYFLIITVPLGCHNKTKVQDSSVSQTGLSEDQRPASSPCLQLAMGEMPSLLSATGCVEPKAPANAAPGLIPYEINAPLWSDGADKERYFAIPADASILADAGGGWEMPPGSVTMKIFRIGGKPVETRIYRRALDGRWSGFSYEWRDDGSDAALLKSGKEKLVGDQPWVIPSPKECDVCHNKAAGVSLGLSEAQLARQLLYPGRTVPLDQPSFLRSIGVLKNRDQGQMLDTGVRLVDYTDSRQTIDARARSYLHGNCAYCHQPKGGGIGDFDLRISRSFQEMHVCNSPVVTSNGPNETVVLAPLQIGKSQLYLRMKDLGEYHMPPRVSRRLDEQGIQLIRDWILIRDHCEEP